MKKRKSTGKFLSRLLCLVTAMGMLVPMALADELGKVPGSSDTNTYEKADIKVEISVVKHVQQTGTETPPAETFEFEVEDTARDEKHPLSYYGIGVEELKLSTTGAAMWRKRLFQSLVDKGLCRLSLGCRPQVRHEYGRLVQQDLPAQGEE